MRRKLPYEVLEDLRDQLVPLLGQVCALVQAEEMSANDGQSERHLQNSNKDPSDFEPCLEKQKGQGPSPNTADLAQDEPTVPLGLVLKACPDVLPYSPDKVRSWEDLIALAKGSWSI